MFFNRVLQTRVIGLAKICSWRGLEKSNLPLLHLRMFLTGSPVIFALEYILCCTDTDKSGSNSYFQMALVLFIWNDQCCSKLFSHTEKIGFSCCRNEEQNCATFPLLSEQAGADGLQQKAKFLPSSNCGLSCSLKDRVMETAAWIQDFSIGGGVLASFALLKVFVSKLDPTRIS